MPGGSSIRLFNPRFLKATRDVIDQIVRVGSISQPLESFDCNSLDWKVAWPNRTRKQLLKLIYRAEASRWARMSEERKDVSATSKSTYKIVSGARKSKMPGGSSVRLLSPRSLKTTRDEIDQIFRIDSISCPIAHHH